MLRPDRSIEFVTSELEKDYKNTSSHDSTRLMKISYCLIHIKHLALNLDYMDHYDRLETLTQQVQKDIDNYIKQSEEI